MDPFHIAASDGDLATVLRLLSSGVDVDLCTSEIAYREAAERAESAMRHSLLFAHESTTGNSRNCLGVKRVRERGGDGLADPSDDDNDNWGKDREANHIIRDPRNNATGLSDSSHLDGPDDSDEPAPQTLPAADRPLMEVLPPPAARMTALHLAVAAGHVEVVKALLDNGAGVGVISEEWFTTTAATADEMAESAMVCARPSRSTALLIAAQNGNIEIARLLLAEESHSSSSSTLHSDTTHLHQQQRYLDHNSSNHRHASSNNVCVNSETCSPHPSAFLASSYFPSTPSSSASFMPALPLPPSANSTGIWNSTHPFAHPNTFSQYTDGGHASTSTCRVIDFQDAEGFTALHWAALSGSADLVDLLLKAGARTDIVAGNGKRAAHYAKGRVLRLFYPSRVDDECWMHR